VADKAKKDAKAAKAKLQTQVKSVGGAAGAAENAQLRREIRELEAKNNFMASMAGTHNKKGQELTYEVTDVRSLEPSAALREGYERFIEELGGLTKKELLRRFVYHTCPTHVLPLIEAGGMRPSQCEMCRGLKKYAEHDDGFFGDHSKGVYVSKHADYTFQYQFGAAENCRPPVPGDVGTVVMMEMVTGKMLHFDERRDGAPPTPGYHCHESPNNLEYYVWDDESTAEPPRATHRLLPSFAVSWKAVLNERTGIVNDQ
jgi:hypothetical protein